MNHGRYIKYLLPAMAILVATLFLISPMQAGTGQTVAPSTAQADYQPDPSLNVQATWSIFNSSMAYNQYVNATGNPEYLNVEPAKGNYISLNPADIQSSTLQNKTYLNASKWTSDFTTSGGIVASLKQDGEFVQVSTNASAEASGQTEAGIPILWNQLPSQNFAYDYITMTGYESGSTAVGWNLAVYNQTAGYASTTSYLYNIIINGTSENTSRGNWSPAGTLGTGGFYASFPLSMIKNLSVTKSTGILIGVQTGTPQETTTQNTITITGFSLTTYPVTLGATSTGEIVSGAIGKAKMSDFSPSIAMQIGNDGYSENLTQPLSLVQANETQAAVASGNYVEQVTYQAKFSLPSAPDLSYSAANFSLGLGAPGSQYVALDVNGVSYLSSIASDQANETVVLLSSVNPTSTISFLAVVDYTASQWNNIAAAPGFFSDPVGFIEYYWWLAISGLGALFGLAGAKYAAGRNAEHDEVIKR